MKKKEKGAPSSEGPPISISVVVPTHRRFVMNSEIRALPPDVLNNERVMDQVRAAISRLIERRERGDKNYDTFVVTTEGWVIIVQTYDNGPKPKTLLVRLRVLRDIDVVSNVYLMEE
jgi:hypothetical protein